jgi:hypothetical protein
MNRHVGTIQGTDVAIEVGCKRIAGQDALRDGEIISGKVHECAINILRCEGIHNTMYRSDCAVNYRILDMGDLTLKWYLRFFGSTPAVPGCLGLSAHNVGILLVVL